MMRFNIKSEMNLMQSKNLIKEVDGHFYPLNNLNLLYRDSKKTRPILNIKKVDGSYYGRVKNKIDYVKLTKNNFGAKIYGNSINLIRWCDIERDKLNISQ